MGVGIGVMALIVVIAVMSGFDYELRNKIIGNISHISIYYSQGVFDYVSLKNNLKNISHIKGISPQAQGQVFMIERNKTFPLVLKGIEPSLEKEVSQIAQYIIKGKLDDLDASGIILGKELAGILGINLNDEVTIYNLNGEPFSLKVKGLFYSGIYDYDLNFVFTNLGKARQIFGLEAGYVNQVGIKLDNLYLAETIKKKIQENLGFGYNVRTWQEINKNFFAALKLEKITMFIILFLIVLVAAFNIISTLIVVVVEKTKDIGILMALGLSKTAIRKIFTFKGLFIGLTGAVWGLAGGLFICFLLKHYQFIKLPQDIYYIQYLPVRIVFWPDIALIILGTFLITLFSTIYPAMQAANLKPIEALRYE